MPSETGRRALSAPAGPTSVVAVAQEASALEVRTNWPSPALR